MEYRDYIVEDLDSFSIYRKNIFYSKDKSDFNENELFKITVKEINDQIAIVIDHKSFLSRLKCCKNLHLCQRFITSNKKV